MPLYVATFKAVAITAAQDLFSILTPATTRLRIREVRIGQYSDFGDAQAEQLPILFQRGATVAGSGGSAVTPAKIEPWTRASVCTVRTNDTTQAGTGTIVDLLSDVWNVAAGFWWYPADEAEQIKLNVSERFVVSLAGAPADSLTCNGSILFEEIGKP